MKRLSGLSPQTKYVNPLVKYQNIVSVEDQSVSQDSQSLSNFINSEFLSPLRVFTPLTSDLPTYLVAQLSESLPKTVTVFSVFNKLTKLNPSKASDLMVSPPGF